MKWKVTTVRMFVPECLFVDSPICVGLAAAFCCKSAFDAPHLQLFNHVKVKTQAQKFKDMKAACLYFRRRESGGPVVVPEVGCERLSRL